MPKSIAIATFACPNPIEARPALQSHIVIDGDTPKMDRRPCQAGLRSNAIHKRRGSAGCRKGAVCRRQEAPFRKPAARAADGPCQNPSPLPRSRAQTQSKAAPRFNHTSLLAETPRRWTAGRVRPAYDPMRSTTVGRGSAGWRKGRFDEGKKPPSGNRLRVRPTVHARIQLHAFVRVPKPNRRPPRA